MQKVLVAEIGSETTIVNAFGDLDTENPRLLGQGLSPTTVLDGDVRIGLRLAVTELENAIGPVGSLHEVPFHVTSSLPTLHAVQEVNEYNFPDVPGMPGILQIVNGRIMPTSEAIMQASQLIYEEVGNVVVLNVGSASTDVYSVTLGTDNILAQRTLDKDLGVINSALTLVKLIGENRIKEHHGQDWDKLIKTWPETPEEIALSAELTAAAVTIALQMHIGRPSNYYEAHAKVTGFEGRNLSRIRWIVGTGAILTQLPNGLDIIRESIKGMGDALFPDGDIAILLDRDCIMASLGALTTTFRQGIWQLLRESLGVEN